MMDSESRPARDVESVLLRDLEGHWGLPSGTLTQGGITHLPADHNMAAWTAEGGAVACQDDKLAVSISAMIAEHEGDDHAALFARLEETVHRSLPQARCSMHAILYCVSPVSPKAKAEDRVEMRRPGDFGLLTSLADRAEHLLVVRAGSAIAAHAWNIPGLRADDRRLHAIGVYVRQEHRGRGLGKAVVSALLEHIASEGDAAVWNVDVTNEASYKLARSVGFVDHVFKFSWEIGDGA